MPSINERSTAWLTITFKNKQGNIQAPNSFRYRIDSNTGQSIRDWITISNPSGSHEITLAPSDNAIVGNRNSDAEEHTITINAIFGPDQERNEVYTYKVVNLNYIT